MITVEITIIKHPYEPYVHMGVFVVCQACTNLTGGQATS